MRGAVVITVVALALSACSRSTTAPTPMQRLSYSADSAPTAQSFYLSQANASTTGQITLALNANVFSFGCGEADPRIRLYDLRHSFGAELYRRTGDLATVARFLGHADGSTVTARYALGANAQVDQAAVQAFNAARSAEQERAALPKRAPKRARARKRRLTKRLRKAS